jgi:hypothetical protein
VSTIVAVLDVLNSREKAALLWILALVAYATVRGGQTVASSFVDVVRAFLQPKLLLVFGSAAFYCAGLVLLAAWVGLWHTTASKETVYWFVTGGLVLVGRAVAHAKPSDPGFYKNLLRQAVRFTILIEFLVNVYVFPLVIELILVPIIILFVGMQVVAAYDPAQAAVRKLVDGALATIGFILLSYAAVAAILDPSGLFTRENAETLLVAPALTLAFVPLLWTWAWVSRRERENLRRTSEPVTALRAELRANRWDAARVGPHAAAVRSTYTPGPEGSGSGSPSSASPSRCKAIAARISRSTSSSVAPVATQPGTSGDQAE